MATTTNYGWDTPDDTDLVKDGAAAIRTLGSSIDTTTKNLNPQTTTGAIAYRSATANVNTALPIGTAGQILAVSGGVPAWINNDQGDITEVQAGTGISVASGTGPIPVVTNTVATAFDAAGDLVYGTGADTFTKLSLGTANQVLSVNSGATAPEWKTPSAGGMTVIAGPTSFDTSSQVNISSIPGTYKDLRLVIRQPANATDNQRISMRFNNDSTANRYALGFGSGDNQSFGNENFFAIPQADNTVIQGIAVFELFDYANTTTFKLCRKSCMTNNATTTTNFNMFVEFSAYNQTGAITEINLFTQAGNIKGTYILYGVS